MANAAQTDPALLTLKSTSAPATGPIVTLLTVVWRSGIWVAQSTVSCRCSLLLVPLASVEEWHVWAVGELRTQVASNRVRLPDVAIVFDDQALNEELRTTPPLIAIEILSPDDRLNRVILRL